VQYSLTLRAALRFAEREHRGQFRKGGDSPYVLHPIAVAMLLAASGADEDLICAGLLHDVVEDAGVDLEDIAASFGDGVAELVKAVTEDKTRSWQQRKEVTIEHLAAASQDVLALKGADVCVNIADVVLDHGEIGEAVWQRFRRGREKQVWYYSTVADAVLDRLTGFDHLRDQLAANVTDLRELVAVSL
jgi:guanosine-3',5'-bis(diphosphate) 3'-pyrophosphohydrolase